MAQGNYEQAGIEAVNRLYRPFNEAQNSAQAMQQKAAGLELGRNLQLQDLATKRKQALSDYETKRSDTLEDAATKREQALSDYETKLTDNAAIVAQADKVARDVADKEADVAAQTAEMASYFRINEDSLREENRNNAEIAKEKRIKLEKISEERQAVNALLNSVNKRGGGVNLGITVADINKSGLPGLAQMKGELMREELRLNANKKSKDELMEQLKAIEVSDEGRDILQETFGTPDPIDWDGEVGAMSKTELDELYSDLFAKQKLRKAKGKQWFAEYNDLKRMQIKSLSDSGILPFLNSQNQATAGDRDSAAKFIFKDPNTYTMLLEALDGDLLGESAAEKARAVMRQLENGNLNKAAELLDDEEAGSQVLVKGIEKWSATTNSAKAQMIQGLLLANQDSRANQRYVNERIKQLETDHPYVKTMDIVDMHSPEELENYRRAADEDGIGPDKGYTPVLTKDGTAYTDKQKYDAEADFFTRGITELEPGDAKAAAQSTANELPDEDEINNALKLVGGDEGEVPDVDVEGGLPTNERTDTARKYLEEQGTGFLGLGSLFMPETYPKEQDSLYGSKSPDELVQAGVNVATVKLNRLKEMLSNLGISRESGRISVSDKYPVGIRPRGGGFELDGGKQYSKSKAEIKEHGIRAEKTFKEIDQIIKDIKLLQADKRQKGLIAP